MAATETQPDALTLFDAPVWETSMLRNRSEVTAAAIKSRPDGCAAMLGFMTRSGFEQKHVLTSQIASM